MAANRPLGCLRLRITPAQLAHRFKSQIGQCFRAQIGGRFRAQIGRCFGALIGRCFGARIGRCFGAFRSCSRWFIRGFEWLRGGRILGIKRSAIAGWVFVPLLIAIVPQCC